MQRKFDRKKSVSRETFLRKNSIFAVIAVLCVTLSSCGGVPYTDEEVLQSAEELVTASFSLNDIYFGEGLPISDNREEVEQFYELVSSGAEGVNYHPVATDCEYQTEADIKEATEAVFTDAYCEYLYELAFKGISAVINEGREDQHVANACYARYIETGGVLTVRLDIPYEAMELTRTYDFTNMEILQRKKHYAVVSVPTQKDGESLDLQLKLVYTENGFRLDTPTY